MYNISDDFDIGSDKGFVLSHHSDQQKKYIWKDFIDRVYTEDKSEIFEDKKKLMFRYKDVIYYQAEVFSTYISSMVGRNVSIQALNQELLKAKLLLPHCGGYVTRLPAKLDPSEDTKNTRFHMIDIYALMDLVQSVYPSPLELFESPIRELRPKAYRWFLARWIRDTYLTG